MAPNILLIGGSLNQTTMMRQIMAQLPPHLQANCYLTPFYADGLLDRLAKVGFLDASILGGRHRRATEAYLAQNGLAVDFGGRKRDYDLIVTCTDLLIQKNLRGKRVILVQEGMTEPEGLRYWLVRRLGLPRYLANTAATGLSDVYDVFCVASPGYRNLFIRKGVRPEKIAVTGIPNFDNAVAYQDNDFPYRNFVLAATSSIRESFGWEDRAEFIRKARQIAAGRLLIFKLHPAEDFRRACREIETHAPGALIYTDGNIHHMIANCDALVTQYSSVVFTALALGKEVHAALDVNRLRQLTPLQNGGHSARRIAHVCQKVLNGPKRQMKKNRKRSFSWERELRGI